MSVLDLRTESQDGRSDQPGTDTTVLLVEDDDVDAKLITRFLVRNHPSRTVLRSRTLGEALELASATSVDVIIADLGLPDAQGVAAADALVGRCPEIPLIVLTGSDDGERAQEALRVGAEDYLHKDQISDEMLNRSMRYAMTRHMTQRRLVATSAALEETGGDLDDFVHVIAHDLRSPLRTSRLLADRMMATVATNDPVAQDLQIRLDSTLERLDEIVLTMLEYASLRGTLDEVVEIDTSEALLGVLTALSFEVESAGAVIDLRIPRGLAVPGSPTLLPRVFENVISNALKYRDPEVAPHIIITHEMTDGLLRVRIGDNGLGVPAADRERVFQVMERLHPGMPGTGFGLSICRRIVQSHDGSIWIEPNTTGGTTVVIDLPVPDESDTILL
jgi:signal transduction histidine kinase